MAAPDHRSVPDDVEEMRAELRTLTRTLPRVEWQARLTLLHRIWELSGSIAEAEDRRPEPSAVRDVVLSA